MTTTPDTPSYCANHPKVETWLRCNKCMKPICVRCSIPTPVGYRCKECANLRPLPTYDVPTSYYIRAVLAATGAATLFGTAWALLSLTIGLGLFVILWSAPFFGYFTGEIVSRAVNRKRGALLVIIGVLALVAAFVLGAFGGPFVAGLAIGAPWELVVARALGLTIRELLDPFVWLLLALGGVLCGSRLR
ncbi:MAG: hypothetical protein NZ518_01960 [Dehalococcoidia bacterium]|nr:hypothetical protein [Dehalococcoidia bacterium]